ncbi:Rhs-family protein [Cutibacterium acnes JCM 18918]|nr:Rhs-family protein [Cutibacterium acnes JCM 18918]
MRLADPHGTTVTMSWDRGLLRHLTDATGANISVDYDKYGRSWPSRTGSVPHGRSAR